MRQRRRISCGLYTNLLRTGEAPCGAPSFCSCRKTVKKEHAREKGFSQSRPSPWTLILRNLLSIRALLMRVRDASLRSTRAGPCGRGMSEAARQATPSVILRSAATKNLKQIRSKILRFAQNDRWGCFRVPTSLSSAQAVTRHSPPHRDCAGRAERGNAHGSVRCGGKTILGGWDSKGKGGFVKSPSLGVPVFLFFPHERKEEAPGGVTPSGGRKSRQTENCADGVVSAYSQAAALPGGRLSGLGERFAGNKNRRRSSGCSACGILTAGEIISRTAFRPCG